MIQGGPDEVSARTIRDAFAVYDWKFREITRRSRARFERRDWHGVHRDARQRLEVYREVVDSVVTEVRGLLGRTAHDRNTWVRVKDCYSELVQCRGDLELARTFFNSVTRRIFSTVGVDPATEYVDEGLWESPRCDSPSPLVARLPLPATGPHLVRALLELHPFACGFRDLEGDALRGGRGIDEHLAALGPFLAALEAGPRRPADRALLQGSASPPARGRSGRHLPLPAGTATPGRGPIVLVTPEAAAPGPRTGDSPEDPKRTGNISDSFRKRSD